MSRNEAMSTNDLSSVVQQSLNVHLYITPFCNLSCSHCYYNALPVSASAKRLLTATEIKDVIITICDNWDADFHMEGGEAFLRRDLPEIIDSVPDSYLRSVTLTTNGIAPISLSASQLALLGNLRVSVESHTDVLQKKIRGVSLKPVLQTFDQLERQGTRFEIRATVVRENVDQIQELVRFFAGVGAARLSLYEFQAVGRARGLAAEMHALTDSDIERLLQVLDGIDLCGFERLTLSLPKNRVAAVERHADILRSTFEIVDVGKTPSLTINYDGSIGVSPWRITAGGVADRFAHLNDVALLSELAGRLADGTLLQLCKSCSAIQLRSRAQCLEG